MAKKFSVYGAGGTPRHVTKFSVYGTNGAPRNVKAAWVYGVGGTPRQFFQSAVPVAPWVWRFNGPYFTNLGSTGACVSGVTAGGYTPMGSLSLVGGTAPTPGFRVMHMRGVGPPDQVWLYLNGATADPAVSNSRIVTLNGSGVDCPCTPAGYDSAVGGFLYIYNNMGFAILQNSNYDFGFAQKA